MITDVPFELGLFQAPPEQLVAGTASIADALGLESALHDVESIGLQRIERLNRSYWPMPPGPSCRFLVSSCWAWRPRSLGCCRLPWQGISQRMWDLPWIRGESRCGLATVVPTRSTGFLAWKAGCEFRSGSTTRWLIVLLWQDGADVVQLAPSMGLATPMCFKAPLTSCMEPDPVWVSTFA